jgi:hypothetical protein
MTKTASNRISVKILLMERHFLYLPLYLAAFDFPEKNKLPFYGKVPSQYNVELKVLPSRNGNSDAAIFEALMDARLDSAYRQNDYMFCVCDPTVLIAKPDKNALMAASLISSSAFWAINHKRDNIRLVSDLSTFDKIICYGEKTTSNLIAQRIVKGSTDKLQEVRPRDEVSILNELGEGELVITPEVLEVANLLHAELGPGQKRCEIVLELSTTKEFSNVLTTAFFTRSEVLEKHPQLVSGLLTALQLALNAIQGAHEIVANCVKHNFRDVEFLENALEITRRSYVFPETIEIRKDRWQRACEFYYISHAVSKRDDKDSLTIQEEQNIECLYEKSVMDRELRRITREAISNAFSDRQDQYKEDIVSISKNWIYFFVFFVICIVAVTASLFKDNTTSKNKIIITVSWMLMVVLQFFLTKRFEKKIGNFLYNLSLLIIGVIWWASHEFFISKAVFFNTAHFIYFIPLDESISSYILAMVSIVATIITFAMKDVIFCKKRLT